MKLVRYGRPGREKPGLIDAEGKLRDLSGIIDDIGPEQLSDKALAKLALAMSETAALVLPVTVSIVSASCVVSTGRLDRQATLMLTSLKSRSPPPSKSSQLRLPGASLSCT